MLTPINEVLEEFVGDFGDAFGIKFNYIFREKMQSPVDGLYIDISSRHLTIHSRSVGVEGFNSDTYRVPDDAVRNNDVLMAGFIYFFRLMGIHMGEERLARYSVTMTERIGQAVPDDHEEPKLVTISFHGRSSWIDVN